MKTFILGVGAQKSGSTWLYQLFRSHPKMNMGFIKEYHVLDSLFIDKHKKIHRLVEKNKNEEAALLKVFLSDIEQYFNYFQRLLNISPDTLFTGDLTPSYAGLDKEAFKLVKESFSQRGINVKVIFIMRDPVERCISAVCHGLDRNGIEKTKSNIESELQSKFHSKNFQYRTKYNKTIMTLEQVFDRDQIFFGFYETLFSENEMLRLSRFLNIDITSPPLNRVVNKHGTDAQICNQLKKEIANYYKQTYEYMISRYGPEVIYMLWKNANLVDY